MRSLHGFVLVATCVLLSSLTGTALAQKTPISVADLFGKAKPGMWVRLEGVPREDQTVQCTKARLITGAIGEDDWSIKGQIRNIDAASRLLIVGRDRVRLAEGYKLKPALTLRSLSDLKVGMYVKVEGSYVPGTGFVARKVGDQSGDVEGKVGAEKKVTHQGKVERVDPARRAIVLMGATYVLSPGTEATSVVKL
jgi:hypothetical protein